MANKVFFIVSLLFVVSGMGAADFVFTESNSAFAQSQSPCPGSASITDTSQAQPGILLVVSNSGQATFTVTGPATYQGSGYAWAQQGIPAGTYTVTWKPVSGCASPPSETKTTDSRGSVAFAGSYKEILSVPKKQTGTIIVIISAPLEADFTISGPENKTVKAASSFQWPYAPVGTYTITYGKAGGGSVYGYDFIPPLPETKILEPDGQIIFKGTYTESKTKVESVPGTTLLPTNQPLPRQSLAPQEQPRVTILPHNKTEQTTPAVSYPVPAKPKGLFSRFWQRILSLFGK